jgi:hypothetical protein
MNRWLLVSFADINVVLPGEYKILFWNWGKLFLKPSVEGGNLMTFVLSFLIVGNLGYVEFYLLSFLRAWLEDRWITYLYSQCHCRGH